MANKPSVTVSAAKSVTTGKWRKDYEPSAVWAGNMAYSDGPVPIEIEVDSDGNGVLRRRRMVSDDASFRRSLARPWSSRLISTPSDLDREIVEARRATLSSERVWNRADTRDPGGYQVEYLLCDGKSHSVE